MKPLAPEGGGEREAKILLVDDRPDKLIALESLLSDMHVPIVKATSGRDALRLLLHDNFALILLDVSMPDMDGFETAALIRQRPKTEHTPIIFITSINTNETHMHKGYSLGAVDYIFTPVVREILRSKVAVFIELHQKNELLRRQAESLAAEAARKAEQLETRLRGLLNGVNVGVFRATQDGKITEANPALLRLLGVNAVELIGAEQAAAICGEEAGTPTKSPCDIQLRDGYGKEIWISLTRMTSRNERGESFIEGLVENITPRKLTEQALKQLNETLEARVEERTEALRISQAHLSRAERLASLGTLAAGIAHEINNPLNSILFASEYALKKKEAERSFETLRTVVAETRRCGKIIRGVLQFARNEQTTKTPQDLNTVVAHAVDLVKTYVSTPLRIKLDAAHGPLEVRMNPTEIEQVLINIIKNAAEAAPGGAEVIVKTERLDDAVLLRIRDAGPGIPPEVKGKIFDPFFSTHSTQGGTGLGLSVAHGIVTAHGGTLSVESEVGKGTEFIIELPIPTAAEAETPASGKIVRTAQEGWS